MDYDTVIATLKTEFPIETLIQFNEFNIQDKLKDSAFMILNYRGLYQREKNKLDQIGALRDKILGERWDWYRFNSEKELKSNEIKDYYLPKDEKVIKVNKLYNKQQWRVDFFEACIEALINQGWRMKSFLDERKSG